MKIKTLFTFLFAASGQEKVLKIQKTVRFLKKLPNFKLQNKIYQRAAG